MPRKIYIIPDGEDPADHTDDALSADCVEVIVGVPPVLAAEVDPESLPTVFTEPDPPPPPPPPPGPTLNDLASDIQANVDLPDAVKQTMLAVLDAVRHGNSPNH